MIDAAAWWLVALLLVWGLRHPLERDSGLAQRLLGAEASDFAQTNEQEMER